MKLIERILGLRIWLILICSLLVVSPFRNASNVRAQDPFSESEVESFSQSVVKLLVEKTDGSSVQGSGVIVSSEGIIFTAAHVVEDAFDIKISVFDEDDQPPRQAYTGRIKYVSDTLDFAIIEIFADQQGQPINTTALDISPIQTWNTNSMIRTEPVYIWAYPNIAAGVLSSTQGDISAITRENDSSVMYGTDAVFGSGGSGGLVINAEGEFVGIPIYFRTDGASSGQLTVFIPLFTICEHDPIACDFNPGRTEYRSEYFIVPLQSSHTWSENLGLSAGIREYQGIPFEVGQFINTYGCPPVEMTDEVDLSTDISSPTVVHFMLQAGNAYRQYVGMKIGRIILEFSDGSDFSVDLVLGDNIRDWSRNFAGAVDTVTSSTTWEVWRGTTEDGREGGIDVISLQVPNNLRGLTLTSIQILDESNVINEITGDDPCIHLQAVTVETR